MIINQNILAILRTFLNLKKNYKKPYTKQTSTAATTEFLAKFLTERTYLMNTLNFVRPRYL